MKIAYHKCPACGTKKAIKVTLDLKDDGVHMSIYKCTNCGKVIEDVNTLRP